MAKNIGRAGIFLGYQNIKEMHTKILKHPVTLYTIGNILLNEGYSNEGYQLIEKAKTLNSNLQKIQILNSFTQENAQYLIWVLTRKEQ